MGIRLADNFEIRHDSVNNLTILENLNTGDTFAIDGSNSIVEINGDEVWDDGSGPTKAVNAVDGSSLSSLNIEQIGSERHYAGAYDGTDADARLDNALSAASDGDSIYLESATYSVNRTISQRLTIMGSTRDQTGSEISGDWTLSGLDSSLQNVMLNGCTLTFNNAVIFADGISTTNTPSITVADNRGMIRGMNGGSVTYQSGTSAGIIDSCMATSVTDNGTNTVGDIA